MTTIGIIGAGEIGSQIARAAMGHGYKVVIANSRGPETLKSLFAELGPSARAARGADAAEAVELARRLYDQFGFGTVDNSPLNDSWRTAPGPRVLPALHQGAQCP
ncbi:NAD(P)-binding domain-containing protein [Streptomyces sp. NPDC050433]|uniref:NAD(P)-binding domain-containing protein n=1 Tax=Streptomyces sp. NPDC050433 TaxID=3365615 RepID=UPI0037901350